MKARRRQNAIDNLTHRKQRRCTAHNERAHTRLHTDFESGEVRGRLDGDIEKTVRHLLVRTPLLTQLRIAETHNIKAETATSGRDINNAGLRCGIAPRNG